MKEAISVSQFENPESRYSFKMIENSESYTIFAQEKGVLIISMFYSKIENKIVSLEGKLGEDLKKGNFTQSEKLERIDDYVKFAFDFYHPNGRMNKNISDNAVEGLLVINKPLKP